MSHYVRDITHKTIKFYSIFIIVLYLSFCISILMHRGNKVQRRKITYPSHITCK